MDKDWALEADEKIAALTAERDKYKGEVKDIVTRQMVKMSYENTRLRDLNAEMLEVLKVTHLYNIHVADCPDTICKTCDDLFNRMLKMVPDALVKAGAIEMPKQKTDMVKQ